MTRAAAAIAIAFSLGLPAAQATDVSPAPWEAGEAALRDKNCAAALDQINRQTGWDLLPERAWKARVSGYLKAGRAIEAETSALQMIDRFHGSADAHALLGLALWKKGDIHGSQVAIGKALAMDQANALGRLGQALYEKATGRPSNAEALLSSPAAAADPRVEPFRDDWYATLGMALMDLHRSEDARKSFETTLAALSKDRIESRRTYEAFIALLEASGGRPLHSIDPEAGVTTVPMKLRGGGYPFVQISINGHRPDWFVVDTGAPGLYLTPSYAKSLGLKPVTPRAVGEGVGGEVGFRLTLLDSVRIGGIEVRNVPAALSEKDMKVKVLKFITVFKLKGLIGVKLLHPFKVTMDFAGKTLTLDPSSKAPAATSEAVPMLVLQDKLVMPSMLDGKGPFLLYIDTGAGGLPLTLWSAAAQRFGIQPPEGGRVTRQEGTGGAEHVMEVPFTLASLSSGSLHWAGVRGSAWFRPDSAGGVKPTRCTSIDPKLDGLLGHPLVQGTRFTIDFRDSQILIDPAPQVANRDSAK